MFLISLLHLIFFIVMNAVFSISIQSLISVVRSNVSVVRVLRCLYFRTLSICVSSITINLYLFFVVITLKFTFVVDFLTRSITAIAEYLQRSFC